MKNKYVIRSKISEAKFRQIIKYFSLDLQANQIAKLTGLNRNSINSYVKAIRQAIINQSDQNKYQIEKYRYFGIVKRNNQITIQPIDHHKYEMTLTRHVDENNLLNAVLDFTEQKYYSVSHHINKDSTEFWEYTKARLIKFRGISPNSYYLHLKECEFRYNNKNVDIYKLMLGLFRQTPLNLI